MVVVVVVVCGAGWVVHKLDMAKHTALSAD